MKKKILIISSILIVVLCIGITQLPGIYAIPTNYSDFEGIVTSKDDSFHNQFDYNNYDYEFITEDAEFTNYLYSMNYSYSPKQLIASIGAPPYGGPNVFINTKIEYPNNTIQPTSEYVNECIQDYLNGDYSKFWEFIYDVSKYWKIYTATETNYGKPILFFKPYNYIEPEYKIECNPTEIAPGETSTCELKVKYHSKIRSLNFKLDTDQYNISNVEAGDDFEDLQENDGVYSLASKSSLEDSEEGRTTTILSFLIKSDGNTVSSADNIKVVDLEYHDELSESPKKMISATVTQSKQEKPDIKNIINNPKTRNNLIIILLMFSLITISIIISKKTNNNN